MEFHPSEISTPWPWEVVIPSLHCLTSLCLTAPCQDSSAKKWRNKKQHNTMLLKLTYCGISSHTRFCGKSTSQWKPSARSSCLWRQGRSRYSLSGRSSLSSAWSLWFQLSTPVQLSIANRLQTHTRLTSCGKKLEQFCHPSLQPLLLHKVAHTFWLWHRELRK